MKYSSRIFFFFVFFSWGLNLQSQVSLLDQVVYLEISDGTIQSLLDEIEFHNPVVFSFNPNRISVQKKVHLSKHHFKLNDILDLFFYDQDIRYKIVGNKLIMLPNTVNHIEISGFIRSSENMELLPGAVLYDMVQQKSVYSNDLGHYSLKMLAGQVNFGIYYLGNIRLNIKTVLTKDTIIDYYLKIDHNLDSVLIIEKYDPFVNVNTSAEKVIDYIRKTFKGKLGSKDVFENIRMMSGVQSGNEAQGGIYIRGGTPDQNLILYEGAALYETSHLGGLSSIFMDEMIRDVDIIKSGFPARYGGRLSSVIDIKLKDGNRYKNNTMLNIGLDAIHLHMDGPLIKNRLSFNFSLRKSLLNYTVSPFITKIIDYNKINLNYYDASLKLSYQINKKQLLSFFYYGGNDNITLEGSNIFEENEVSFEFTDQSKIGWGTQLFGLNYQYKLANNLFFHAHLSTLDYNRYSRGSYKFNIFNTTSISEYVDVLVYSGIKDNTAKWNITYDYSKNHTFRLGGIYKNHNNNPAIHQSKSRIDSTVTELVSGDSAFVSTDISFYIEDKININNSLDIYMGLHWNNYIAGQSNYSSFQPRIAIKWHLIKGLTIMSSASKMQQNIHFLVNPGLGLPSELWVPATEQIEPQKSLQYGLGLSYFNKDMLRIGIDFYIKKYSSILEFDNPNDLFYAYILNESSLPLKNSKDWTNHLEKGKADVKTLEFYLFKKWNKFDWWVRYNWTNHKRIFPNLNDGDAFPSKFDRTHDLLLKSKWQINDLWSITASWVYGTGNTFTLPLDEYPDIEGFVIKSINGRNNLRFPDYHHLDISISLQTKIAKNKLNVTAGIYNAYNNANPFYIYFINDEISGKNVLKQVSIYDFVPFLNIHLSI